MVRPSKGNLETLQTLSSMASAFALPRLPERNARAARYSMSLLFLARRKPFTETFPHFTVGRGSPRTPLSRRPSSAGDVLLCDRLVHPAGSLCESPLPVIRSWNREAVLVLCSMLD